ncbi:Outer membrane drug efflux lipoprotein [Burkholderiales bacterium]|nr:Outer membrane drug efflux lipoprotein [Burkholderiales bacterium]
MRQAARPLRPKVPDPAGRASAGAPRFVLLAAIAGGLGACTLGPDYHKPAIEVPPAWKTEEPWRVGTPDDAARRGAWWEVFADPGLDGLQMQAIAHNPSLDMAVERLAQARAIVTVTGAALFPRLDANLAATRNKTSADRPLALYNFANGSVVQNDLVAGFSVHYEADLFGGIRRQTEAARASEQQSQADLENARLVLTAEVAADYFDLRALDAEIDVVRQNIAAQRRALEFVSSRHDMGVASGLDLAQAQAQLDSTITQIDLLRVQRAQFEHALASLVGTPAPSFAIAPAVVKFSVPDIPVGVPSDVLERRPDVASAERAMAAANAQIGVAKAAYFPSVPLEAVYGVESNKVATLFSAASNLWSLGIAATQTLFDAGRRSANIDFAQAGYRATVASYRQAVLTAMQEAEDGMSGSANLARAASEANAAVHSAQRVVDLANDRYAGGLATYLDVVTAEQALLANQRLQVQINGQQMLVAVYLVKALGGGWQSTDAPIAAAGSTAAR